jgi:hypothetical protein
VILIVGMTGEKYVVRDNADPADDTYFGLIKVCPMEPWGQTASAVAGKAF